jgi:aspartate aminotransferase-like enzyme
VKFHTDRLIMTPGSTEVPLRVKKARGLHMGKVRNPAGWKLGEA